MLLSKKFIHFHSELGFMPLQKEYFPKNNDKLLIKFKHIMYDAGGKRSQLRIGGESHIPLSPHTSLFLGTI